MNKVDLHYTVEGSGETIVFVHGLSDNLTYWEFLASNLRHDYRVVRVDLRGHGQTELGDEGISIETYSEDLNGLLDDLNIDKINLVGFSMGSTVALDFTLRYPDIVSSLVLMACFYKADEHSEIIFNRWKDALKISFNEFYDLILPMVVCPDFIENNKAEIEMLREIASKSANVPSYIAAIDACLNFDIGEELSNIGVPTLILAGRYDEITPLGSQKELQGKIRNSKLIVFDDVRHNLLIGENNEKILNILKKRI